MGDILNEDQVRAVEYPGRYVLVNAGPGSGKTRVIIERVKRFLTLGIDPRDILLLTFTNNAAKEMVERIDNQNILACTFHSYCYRVLREFLPPEKRPFSVIDEDDQTKLVKSILVSLDSTINPDSISEYISLRKSKGIPPSNSTKLMEVVYREYNRLCKKHNMYDFGELQLEALNYASLTNGRFKHILIDEYQDTDPVQWEFTKLISVGTESMTVVCDEQQSIYGWRGADIQNVLKYPEHFGADIITLRRNYRSTPEIVEIVNKVVNSATEKLCDKELYSERPSGTRPKIITYNTDRDEARDIVNMIARTGKPHECMILYRANWMSRILEEELTRQKIPYKITDGVGFYRRREIKDIIAYLRLLYNPIDESAASRIVNVPARGIGKVALVKLVEKYGSICEGIVKSSDPKVSSLRSLLTYLRDSNSTPSETIKNIINITNYEEYIQDQDRMDNIGSLISGAQVFGGSLEDYMMMITLLTDNTEPSEFTVRLMTVHGSKGTEANNVFVIGLEQGILPHKAGELEEERRLFYVAISRAKDNLVLSNSRRRWVFDRSISTSPSEFLDIIR